MEPVKDKITLKKRYNFSNIEQLPKDLIDRPGTLLKIENINMNEKKNRKVAYMVYIEERIKGYYEVYTHLDSKSAVYRINTAIDDERYSHIVENDKVGDFHKFLGIQIFKPEKNDKDQELVRISCNVRRDTYKDKDKLTSEEIEKINDAQLVISITKSKVVFKHKGYFRYDDNYYTPENSYINIELYDIEREDKYKFIEEDVNSQVKMEDKNCMFIISQHLKTLSDFKNIEKACKTFRGITEMCYQNPISIDIEGREADIFPNIKEYQIFDNELLNLDDFKEKIRKIRKREIYVITMYRPVKKSELMFIEDDMHMKLSANKAGEMMTMTDLEKERDVIRRKRFKFVEGKIDIGKVNKVDLSKTVLEEVKYVFYKKKLLDNIIFPETLVSLGDKSVYGNVNLTNIVLPDSVTYLGDECFYGCKNLNQVNTVNVIKVGERCFKGCKNLTEIRLPNVETLGSQCFEGCDSLINVQISENVNELPKYCFNGCQLLFGIVFSNTTNQQIIYLNNIVIPNNITKISEGCFSKCKLLVDVTLPNNLSVLYNETFRDCVNLTNITIPNTVTLIKEECFKNCISLSKIEIPISNIDCYGFKMCTNLKEITFKDNPNAVNVDAGRFVKFNGTAFKGCSVLTRIEFPRHTTNEIEEFSLDECINLKEVILPDGLERLISYAFCSCYNLTKIELGSRLTYIGDGCFRECSNLKEIDIPSSVSYIGKGCFNRCSKLTRINIPSNVSVIRSNCFKRCVSLKRIIIGDNENDDIIIEGENNLITLDLPSYITVESRAFTSCNSIKKVIIRTNKIEPDAFYLCNNIEEIDLYNQNEEIISKIFIGCKKPEKINKY